jgi:hypothetical protein
VKNRPGHDVKLSNQTNTSLTMIESILATVLPIAKDLLITAAVAVAAYAMSLIQEKIQMI